MDPRRRSLRFASKASSTPAPKKSKKIVKRRKSLGPVVIQPDNPTTDVQDNNAVPDNNFDNIFDNNAGNNVNHSTIDNNAVHDNSIQDNIQDNIQATNQSADIIDEYTNVLLQDAEESTMLSYHSENGIELKLKVDVIAIFVGKN